MAYLYNFINKPSKTQEYVHQILTTLYQNAPDGISGNEDCGQMSAWYVLSSLGFYPVTPGSNDYIIGTPLFEEAIIHLENGNSFNIKANMVSDENIYIQSATLNGKAYPYSYLKHEDIIKGGELVFEMTDQPSTWGTTDDSIPETKINEHHIVTPPLIAKGEIAFKDQTKVVLKNLDNEAKIFYKLVELIQPLNAEFKAYKAPLVIKEKSILEVYSQKDGLKSPIISTHFFKIDPNLKISLETEYANQYNAGGDNALIDGIRGTEDFRTGTWQGYWNEDVIATVDLGRVKGMNSIEMNFLQDQKSWIFLPTEVELLISKNGQNFQSIHNQKLDAVTPLDKPEIFHFSHVFKLKEFRYVKVIAKKLGELPEWHLGHAHDGRSWIFIDEIEVK
jgi:hypothetical protein